MVSWRGTIDRIVSACGAGMAVTALLGACASAPADEAKSDSADELGTDITSDEWSAEMSDARTFDTTDTRFDDAADEGHAMTRGMEATTPDIELAARRPSYHNPILGKTPCPDPSVLRHGGAYYMVCTSWGNPSAFPIRKSHDLVHWRDIGDVFPKNEDTHPKWATHGTFWAPELYSIGGFFVVYFAAKRTDGHMAIGAAAATNVRGPFHDIGRPLFALPDGTPSGAIDPTVVRDPRDGSLYMYFCVQPKQIYVIPLDATGLATLGKAKHLFTADLPWEKDEHGHAVAEGPESIYRDGWFYLFWSGASTFDGSYAVGVARSRDPLGPFEPYAANPILSRGTDWLAPGHGSHVVRGPDGADYMLYHAIARGTEVRKKGDPLPRRLLFLDQVTWDTQGWPHLRSPHPNGGAEPLP